MIDFFVIVYGLLIGSFLNVCIFRIPKNQSISFPPSHCTSCKNKIKWYDLIPVISYIILKGKCRYCSEKISIQYPIIEIITASMFYGLYYKYGLTITFFKYAILVCFLIVCGVIDFFTTDVYLKVTLPGIVIGFIFAIYEIIKYGNITNYLLGAIISWGIIALIILITKGMGWGDAEICLMAGIFLGFKLSLLMIFLSFIFGAVGGILLIILKKKSRKDMIPFGPFIALATIFTIFFGNYFLNYYYPLL